MGKRGRPSLEPTQVKAVRLPVRLWKLLRKASKRYRSVNELLNVLVENHLVEIGLMDDKDRKRPIKPKTKKVGGRKNHVEPL